jgi:hypothetical protein
MSVQGIAKGHLYNHTPKKATWRKHNTYVSDCLSNLGVVINIKQSTVFHFVDTAERSVGSGELVWCCWRLPYGGFLLCEEQLEYAEYYHCSFASGEFRTTSLEYHVSSHHFRLSRQLKDPFYRLILRLCRTVSVSRTDHHGSRTRIHPSSTRTGGLRFSGVRFFPNLC